MTKALSVQIAETILEGFDQHYQYFMTLTRGAAERFIAADWAGVQAASKDRIQSYDKRVKDTVQRMADTFSALNLGEEAWAEIKSAYTEILSSHLQPELAESFFNSVFCRMFDRRYYNNDHIFVHSETDASRFNTQLVTDSYPVPPPDTAAEIAGVMVDHINALSFALPFEDIERDHRHIYETLVEFSAVEGVPWQLEILHPVFYRNKAAYVIGRLHYDEQQVPFLIPILNNEKGGLFVDAVILDQDDLAIAFGFARAYFMVDTEHPGALVSFLQALLPSKTAAELYTCIGLQKHGKTLFYRDFLNHLNSTDDAFVVAPGIKGMVMHVFTLASYPYVFKLIKDKFAPQKDMTRATVREKYQLVKQHDRVGRMADTWEFSYVAFPKSRFAPELLAELEEVAPSLIKYEGDQIILRHCYIERRMIPLNLYLDQTDNEQVKRDAIREYGAAIKEISAANIFPGDMLFKNFGVTRHGRVIFYDYDEICYLTECNFRHIPPPRYPEDELAAEPWYSVAPNDIFPEEFAAFLLCDPQTRRVFCQLHPELLNADYWQQKQQNIEAGIFEDVFPYPDNQRFKR